MNNNQADNLNSDLKDNFTADPAQQNKLHEGEKAPGDEGTLLKEEDKKGMDMGTTFHQDKEQDLDDLIHSQAKLTKNEFLNPDEA